MGECKSRRSKMLRGFWAQNMKKLVDDFVNI